MVARCDRRRRRMRGANTGWNSTVKQGIIVGYTCPNCQTPEENAEAEINAATTEYSLDAFGRHIGRMKVSA